MRSSPDSADWMTWHTLMLDDVFARAGDFDVIHFHVDFLHYPLAQRCDTPSLTTMHGRLDLPHLKPLHRRFAEHPLVSISDYQRGPLAEANFVATVHHGLPPRLYDFTAEPQDFFVFVGRVSPEKRLDRAIEIAIACNTRLIVAAKVDVADRAYFDSEIKPRLAHPLVEFIGEVDDAGKNTLMGGAKALLFPIDWPEPFGLVVIESLACGTPVVAYGLGSVPELLEDGVTGFMVDNQRAAIEAARNIGRIDRRRCRQAFDERFTSRKMAEHYLGVYRQLLAAPLQQALPTDFAGASIK